LTAIWVRLSATKRCTLEDRTRWAARLTPNQFATLRYIFPGLNPGSYSYLRLRASLTPAQVRQLDREGLRWHLLRPDQQQQTYRWAFGLFPLRADDSVASLTVSQTVEPGGMLQWELAVPPFEPESGQIRVVQLYDPVAARRPLD
jgi:hypothetical protein